MSEEPIKILVKRPLSLTVFCVLSILGSSYYFSSSLNGYMDSSLISGLSEGLVESLNETQKLYGAAGATEQTESFISNAVDDVETNLVPFRYKQQCLTWLFGSFCTLVGAFLMFRMRKIGFHFYVGGTIIMLVGTFVSYGFGFVGWTFNAMNLLFGVIFSLFYLSKLKVMH